jgi:hypothetical protein
MFYWAVECLARIGEAGGFSGYWYHYSDFFKQMANRFDLMVTLPPSVVYLVYYAVVGLVFPGENRLINRIILIIPSARVFSLLALVRYEFLGGSRALYHCLHLHVQGSSPPA